jgi:hypothetical protein
VKKPNEVLGTDLKVYFWSGCSALSVQKPNEVRGTDLEQVYFRSGCSA